MEAQIFIFSNFPSTIPRGSKPFLFSLKNSSYEKNLQSSFPLLNPLLATIKRKFRNGMIYDEGFKDGWKSEFRPNLKNKNTRATGNIVHRFDPCYLWYLRCTPATRLSCLLLGHDGNLIGVLVRNVNRDSNSLRFLWQNSLSRKKKELFFDARIVRINELLKSNDTRSFLTYIFFF